MDLQKSPTKNSEEPAVSDGLGIAPRRRSSRLLMKRSSSTEPREKETVSLMAPEIQRPKEANEDRPNPPKPQISKTPEMQGDNDLRKFDIDLSHLEEHAGFEDSFIFEQKPVKEIKVQRKTKQVQHDLLNFLAPQNFKTAIPAPHELTKVPSKPLFPFAKLISNEQPNQIIINQSVNEQGQNPFAQKRIESGANSQVQSKQSSPQRVLFDEQRPKFAPKEISQISPKTTLNGFPLSLFNSVAIPKDINSKGVIQNDITEHSPPKCSKRLSSRRLSDRFKKILGEEVVEIPALQSSDHFLYQPYSDVPQLFNDPYSRPTAKVNRSMEVSPPRDLFTTKAIEKRIPLIGFESTSKFGRAEPGNQQHQGFISMSPLNKTMMDASMLSELETSPNRNAIGENPMNKKANELFEAKNVVILDYAPEEENTIKPNAEEKQVPQMNESVNWIDSMGKSNQNIRHRASEGGLDQIFKVILDNEHEKENSHEGQLQLEPKVTKKINTAPINAFADEQFNSKPKTSIFEESTIQLRDNFTFADAQAIHNSVQPPKNQNKASILTFGSNDQEPTSAENQPLLNNIKSPPIKADETKRSNQVQDKAISLGPNQLIIGSRQMRSTGDSQEYFKKVYQEEVNNVLCRHLRLEDDTQSEDSGSKQPTLAQIVHKAIQILDEFYRETEKLVRDDQNNSASEIERSLPFNSRTRENLLKQYIFNKILFALKRSSKISFYKNFAYKIDRTFEDLYSVLAALPKRRAIAASKQTTHCGRTSSFLNSVFSLKVNKVMISEDGRQVDYNFQFQENLSMSFKTNPKSRKVTFVQLFLVQIPRMLKQRISDKNSVTDLIIRNFQERVGQGFTLELFDSLAFICTSYHSFISLYEKMEQMYNDKVIQEYSADKEGKFSVRVRLLKIPFFDLQFLIWMSPQQTSNISYHLKNLDVTFQKLFAHSIKLFIKSLNEKIKTQFISSYAPIASRVDNLFKLMHKMSLSETAEPGNSLEEGVDNEIAASIAESKEYARSATSKPPVLKGSETIEIAD